MRDGDIDYSNYTLLELEEALAGIDRRQFPKNYANLCSAYAAATRASVSKPQSTPATDDTAERDTQTAWNKFRASRPVAGALGAVCLWWAYDVFTQPGPCPSARKLVGAIVNTICENYGHTAAASIPFVLGLVSAMYAVTPRRRDGS